MKQILDSLTADYVTEHGADSITYRVQELINTLASIIDDEQRVEQIVKSEGAAYSTTGDKGQQVVKKRPEAEELQKLRQQKLQYLKQLGLGSGKAGAVDW